MKKSAHESNLLSSQEIQLKVEAELVNSVYKQFYIGAISSFLCASVVLIGLYSVINHKLIIAWYIAFLLILFFRQISVKKYLQTPLGADLDYWRKVFIAGACASDASWGVISGVLFPYPYLMPLVLDVLILAGVTAGAVPLLSGILNSAVGFLVFALLPLNIRLLFLGNSTLLLFDFALFVYLLYLLVLSAKTHKMTRQAISLQFENEALLQNLSEAKE